jgi:hypothetical protein
MDARSTKALQMAGSELPSSISDQDALRYIQELAETLREMAEKLGHDGLARRLADSSAEAARLASGRRI